MQKPRFDDFSEDQLRQIEAKWKSDIERKMDALMGFVSRNEAFLNMLIAREQRSAEFRRAVIEHTLKTVILSGVVAIGALIWSGMKTEFADFMRLFGKQ